MSKEIPKGYKKTEIGILPEDWEVVRLEDVGKILTGSTPSKKVMSFWNNGNIKFVKPPNLDDTIIRSYSEMVARYAKNLRIVPKNSTLVSCIGKIGKTGFTTEETAFNQQINAIIPDNSVVDPKFLFFSIQTQKEQLRSLQSNTIMPIVNKSKFSRLLIPLPPLEEQKKIAKVLDTIRKAIEVQNNLIKTWKKMKKAVMEKVFRKGLHGEELKETEIGEIPKSWEVVSVGEVAEVKYGKAKPKNDNYGKIPVIGSGGIYSYTSKPLISEPTIIIGRKGTAGKVWLILQPCYPSDTTFYLKINREIDISFLFYYLLLVDLSGEEEKTTLPSLQRQHLENLPIPLPPLEEQKQIAQILSTIDKKIEIEQRRKEVLQKLFKSMLHLLMTGKIRVKEVKI